MLHRFMGATAIDSRSDVQGVVTRAVNTASGLMVGTKGGTVYRIGGGSKVEVLGASAERQRLVV